MRGIQIFNFNYEEAENYFDVDAEHLEFLKSLSDEEKENYHLRVTIDHDNQSAYFEVGNWAQESNHLVLFNNEINNTIPMQDDYDGVLDFLKREKYIKEGLNNKEELK